MYCWSSNLIACPEGTHNSGGSKNVTHEKKRRLGMSALTAVLVDAAISWLVEFFWGGSGWFVCLFCRVRSLLKWPCVPPGDGSWGLRLISGVMWLKKGNGLWVRGMGCVGTQGSSLARQSSACLCWWRTWPQKEKRSWALLPFFLEETC